jgi:hypothetical protein
VRPGRRRAGGEKSDRHFDFQGQEMETKTFQDIHNMEAIDQYPHPHEMLRAGAGPVPVDVAAVGRHHQVRGGHRRDPRLVPLGPPLERLGARPALALGPQAAGGVAVALAVFVHQGQDLAGKSIYKCTWGGEGEGDS